MGNLNGFIRGLAIFEPVSKFRILIGCPNEPLDFREINIEMPGEPEDKYMEAKKLLDSYHKAFPHIQRLFEDHFREHFNG